MDQELKELKVSLHDFYLIVNSMRDSCGCKECLRVTNNLLAQSRGEAVNCCHECRNAITGSESFYHETYRLCQRCYAVWVKADEEALAKEKETK